MVKTVISCRYELKIHACDSLQAVDCRRYLIGWAVYEVAHLPCWSPLDIVQRSAVTVCCSVAVLRAGTGHGAELKIEKI